MTQPPLSASLSYYLQNQCSSSHFSSYPVPNVKAPSSQAPHSVFSKTLPHDSNGRPSQHDLALFQKASGTMTVGDWQAVPRGGSAKLVDSVCIGLPTLEGADAMALISYDTPLLNLKPTVPGSAYHADCMLEVYALMLSRDVPLSYLYERASEPHPLLDRLVTDLAQMSLAGQYFPKNRVSGVLTRKELFRGRTAGDLQGPYISQFMLLDIPTYEAGIPQKYLFPPMGSGGASEYMKTMPTYLAVANGTGQEPKAAFETVPRHVVTGRDYAQVVHNDFCYEPYFHAAKIMTTIPGAFALPQSPYNGARHGPFVNISPADAMASLAQGCHIALFGAWKHKWWNLLMRPEELAKEVELWRLTNQNPGNIHSDLLASDLLQLVISTNGNALLRQCYPEGCPAHPSWPAGHATVAGCCTTILKAYTNPNARMPRMFVPHESGRFLVPINVADYGESQNPLVLDELDKLASNISFSRDTAGVHFRADGEFGMHLGELLALEFLRDKVQSYQQSGFSFSFNVRLFDGTFRTISPQ